ncbi:MAG TPA: MinD/ParA family protein [Dissulfurispiraceae bacterium]|nr:MinD/ParA family protein [Dissulfurispiraceae bacterium]
MPTEQPKIIAVSSGKGGVGKTNFVANLALFYASINKKVLVMDADVGLSNIDVILGIAPKFNLRHVLSGQKRLKDIIVQGPLGITIIPAGSGVRELTRLTEEQKLMLVGELEEADVDFDVFLIDTGAGISDNVLFFCSAAQEVVILVTPEPTSIADAYAIIKVLKNDFRTRNFRLIVNMARTEKEAFDTFSKLSLVADKFLGIPIDYLGFLPYDQNVKDSIMAQKSHIVMHPNSLFAKKLAQVAKRLADLPPADAAGSLQFFLRRALRIG